MKLLVPTISRQLADYREVAGEEALEDIRLPAKPLQGARVLHLSVFSSGTLTSELLNSLIPLTRAAGLDAEWGTVVAGEAVQASITTMYEALNGTYVPWTRRHHDNWLRYSDLCVDLVERNYDFVVIHDPQLAAVRADAARRLGSRLRARWIWHCHMDLRAVQPEIWALLRPYLATYDAVIYEDAEYRRDDLEISEEAIIGPAIDPASARNAKLSEEIVKTVLHAYGLNGSRPLLVQVSRLDRWSNPLGAMEIYRMAKQAAPALQYLLVATVAAHDYQAQMNYELLASAADAAADPDVHFACTLNRLGHTEINAFQTAATVVLHNGLRRGYDPHLLEAMWKSKPIVVNRTAAGQFVQDGLTGCVVPGVAEAKDGVLGFLGYPERARKVGEAARARVRERFLITKHLRDHLLFLGQLANLAGATSDTLAFHKA